MLYARVLFSPPLQPLLFVSVAALWCNCFLFFFSLIHLIIRTVGIHCYTVVGVTAAVVIVYRLFLRFTYSM